MTAPHVYEQADVPEGQTLAQWRASRARERQAVQAQVRASRRFARRARVAEAVAQRPVLLTCCVLGVHCAHVALGLPALEGVEQVLVAAAGHGPQLHGGRP